MTAASAVMTRIRITAVMACTAVIARRNDEAINVHAGIASGYALAMTAAGAVMGHDV
jgi:hypothetical protein